MHGGYYIDIFAISKHIYLISGLILYSIGTIDFETFIGQIDVLYWGVGLP